MGGCLEVWTQRGASGHSVLGSKGRGGHTVVEFGFKWVEEENQWGPHPVPVPGEGLETVGVRSRTISHTRGQGVSLSLRNASGTAALWSLFWG